MNCSNCSSCTASSGATPIAACAEKVSVANRDIKSIVIRSATFSDARQIFTLIRENSDNLVVRSLSNIVENIDRFLVAVTEENEVVAVISYGLWAEFGDPLQTTAELQSVCVKPGWRKFGIGRRLVEAQLAILDKLDVWQIVVLTFEVEFFGRLGFEKIEKQALMYKLYRGCINCSKHESPFTCPEQAMVRRQRSAEEK